MTALANTAASSSRASSDTNPCSAVANCSMENSLLAVDAGDKTAQIVANRPRRDKPKGKR
jgi:hypothetical protein